MFRRPPKSKEGQEGIYFNRPITSPNNSSSDGNTFGVTSGLETQVSLIRSRQVTLLLVLLPPHEPQPSEKVWRMPFHKLPLFDGA